MRHSELPGYMQHQFNDPQAHMSAKQLMLQTWLRLELHDDSLFVIRQNLHEELYDIWQKCDDGMLFCHALNFHPDRFNTLLIEEMKFSKKDRLAYLRSIEENNEEYEKNLDRKQMDEIADAVEATCRDLFSPRAAGKLIFYPGQETKSKNAILDIN